MLGFATTIDAEDTLKNGVSVQITRFFGCIYCSTQPTDLFSSSRLFSQLFWQMNFFIYCFILCVITLTLGCTDTERPDAIGALDETETAVITTEQRNQNLTEEERGRKVIEHLEKYLQLKAKNPDAAYAELQKSADLTWWSHPFAEQWTQLTFRIDTAGKASIMDMMQRVALELQMAKDRSPYKEQVIYLEGRLRFWKDKKERAEAEGRNPHEADIKFEIRIAED